MSDVSELQLLYLDPAVSGRSCQSVSLSFVVEVVGQSVHQRYRREIAQASAVPSHEFEWPIAGLCHVRDWS